MKGYKEYMLSEIENAKEFFTTELRKGKVIIVLRYNAIGEVIYDLKSFCCDEKREGWLAKYLNATGKEEEYVYMEDMIPMYVKSEQGYSYMGIYNDGQDVQSIKEAYGDFRDYYEDFEMDTKEYGTVQIKGMIYVSENKADVGNFAGPMECLFAEEWAEENGLKAEAMERPNGSISSLDGGNYDKYWWC